MLILLFSALAHGNGTAQQIPIKLSQYAHTAWRLQDGAFDGGTPSAIAQTTDGYLWIYTSGGLVRFDGVNFVPWKDPQAGGPTASVRSLAASRDGSLWLSVGLQLGHIQDGKLTILPRKLGWIETIHEDAQGVIWVGRLGITDGQGPLCELHNSEFQCHGKPEGINCTQTNAIAEDSAGTLWLGDDDHLCVWKAGSGKSIEVLPKADVAIASLLSGRDGSLLFGYTKGGRALGLRQLIAGKSIPFTLPRFDGSTLSVYSLRRDRNNDLWIGTANLGLFHVTRGSVDHFGVEDGLSSNTVSDIYEDREGNVWVVTPGGVDQFRRTSVVSYTTRQGLSSDRVSSVIAWGQGTVFAASDLGLQVLRQGSVSTLSRKNGLPAEILESMAEDSAGDLWIEGEGRLARYSHGRFSVIPPPNGKTWQALTLAVDSEQTIWAQDLHTRNLLYRVHKNLVIEQIPVPAPRLREMYADPAGTIWVVANGGKAFRYRNNAFEQIPEAPDKPGFNQMFSDGADSMWFGTYTKGIYRWKDGRWGVLNPDKGLPGVEIDAIAVDRKGALWLDLPAGFARFERDEVNQWWIHPDYHPRFTLYGAAQGAIAGSKELSPRTARSSDGELWFANGEALMMIDPDHLQKNSLPPPVHVQQLTADRIAYPNNGSATLPALTRDIRIDYTALSFTVPKAVRFRFKLSTIDKDWQDVEGRRQAFYMNLRPGSYRFQVIACNNDGVWNLQGDQLSFTILPAFYQTGWFWISVICVALLGMWLSFQLRVRIATAQLESRMGERLMERDRIARELHDTLLQGFQGLLLQLQTAIRRIPASEPERERALATLDRGDEILLEGRERVRDLRSHETSYGPLVSMLEKTVHQLRLTTGPEVHLLVDGEPRDVRLLVAEEVLLFAREALTNAVRHSQGSHIRCQLQFQTKDLLLLVQDDGIGIADQQVNADSNREHWGLQGMKERADKLHGKMKIQTGSDGTNIELCVQGRVAYPKSHYGIVQKFISLLIDRDRT